MNIFQAIKNAVVNAKKQKLKEIPFQRLDQATSFRTLAVWGGFLPRTPYARHHLAVVDITERSCEIEFYRTGFRPFRVDAYVTTEVWVGFRYYVSPDKFRLVFRSQFDLRVPGRSTRKVAEEVGEHLAQVLRESKHHWQLIEYNSDLERDCEAAYKNILLKALKNSNLSMEAFEIQPEKYKTLLSRP